MKWYEKNVTIILFLVFFFPVGLFLMWKYGRWNKVAKIAISIFFALVLIANIGGNKTNQTATTKTETATVQEQPKEKTEEEKAAEVADQKADEEAKANAKADADAKKAKDNIPKEYQSALKKADTYANGMNLSKKGLYEQLTSDAGEKFPKEAAQYAVDNVKADWKKNALAKAKIYQDEMSLSKSAIHDQLVADAGEKFTEEEAQYAINNLEK
ncbi:Ltp family lipoprotein [Clostridium sp. SHJSY1]|uniref:Ltp family lipoprotein n=1 Tax=Clostridium sp. SHJSY1 TaxID=2942483 RepID=UPI002874208D|nr:Ltp family lipoprotein [Clostridium sp. SHJSY1]MDS0525439.1 Ltp family lipoprotein [Clostridium sp. SHJSY1]